MEQAPNLTMASSSAPPSPMPGLTSTTPTPDQPDLTQTEARTPPATAASPAGTLPANQPATTTGVQTTVERAFQHGLNRANLEQEVGQVMGTLSGWWGGVKKQSASAISSLKADLDKTVIQAQADLEHLRNAKVEVVRKDPAQFNAEKEAERERKGKQKETEAGDIPTTAFPQSATALLDRISSSTSQLQSTLQTTLQSTLAANPGLTNPAQLRAQLAQNLHISSARENLQLSMKQAEKLAEEYLRKGDQWVKDAEKWVGEAVKVVPPEGDGDGGVHWDGSDWYSFSTSSASTSRAQQTVLFDAEAKTPRASVSSIPLAGSRKDAMMRRLREDKTLLMVDPGAETEDAERQAAFRQWLANDWESAGKEGRAKEEGQVGAIRMALVPEHLADEQFWQRYLFHKHMIEAEDERRKKLLQATQNQQQEDFSWDDEPEESTPPAVDTAPAGPSSETPESRRTPTQTQISQLPAGSTPKPNASTSTSPRDSEESYDLVSDQGGRKVAPPADDDEDSDWE